MTQCLLFVLPVQTATEIDSAGHAKHTVVKREVCAAEHRHMGGKKRQKDKAK